MVALVFIVAITFITLAKVSVPIHQIVLSDCLVDTRHQWEIAWYGYLSLHGQQGGAQDRYNCDGGMLAGHKDA